MYLTSFISVRSSLQELDRWEVARHSYSLGGAEGKVQHVALTGPLSKKEAEKMAFAMEKVTRGQSPFVGTDAQVVTLKLRKEGANLVCQVVEIGQGGSSAWVGREFRGNGLQESIALGEKVAQVVKKPFVLPRTVLTPLQMSEYLSSSCEKIVFSRVRA